MSTRLRHADLKARRTAAGIPTNAALAEAAGINESTLQRLIAGTVQPSMRAVEGLCTALGCEFGDLFEFEAERRESA